MSDITIKRFVITMVIERVEIQGTQDQLAEMAHKIAPSADGWRFMTQGKSEGLIIERYERDTSRKIVPKDNE
jgi:hypothetical protein